jgi:hypothetical protein
VLLDEPLPRPALHCDEQHIICYYDGRCGRQGKAGVVQFHVLEEKVRTIDSEALYLDRLRKHVEEENDMGSKTNRIQQHRHDGSVLDRYCEWLPIYASQWMSKLFPIAPSVTPQQSSSDIPTTVGSALLSETRFLQVVLRTRE